MLMSGTIHSAMLAVMVLFMVSVMVSVIVSVMVSVLSSALLFISLLASLGEERTKEFFLDPARDLDSDAANNTVSRTRPTSALVCTLLASDFKKKRK